MKKYHFAIFLTVFATFFTACTTPAPATPSPLATSVATTTALVVENPTEAPSAQTTANDSTPTSASVQAEPSATSLPAETNTPTPLAQVPAATLLPAGSVAPNMQFEYGGQVNQLEGQTVVAMRRARMQWAKVLIDWQPGLKAENYINTIESVHQRGFKLLLTINLPPGSAKAEYFPELGWFVQTIAYKGADAIQVGDIVNTAEGWQSEQISPTQYAELLKIVRKEIRSSGKSPILISAALDSVTPFSTCDQNGCGETDYLSALQASGALDLVDCVGVNSLQSVVSPKNTTGDPRPTALAAYYLPTHLESVMKIVGSKPLCLTELGYLSGQEWGQVPTGYDWAGSGGLSVEQQKLFTAEALELLLYQPNVRLAIFYNVDYTRYDNDPQAGFALLRPTGDCGACDLLRQVMDNAYPIAKEAHPTPMAVIPQVTAIPWDNNAAFELGGQVGAFGPNTVNVMKDLKMGWVKHQIVWNSGANPADFYWFIDNAHEKGFKVLLSVKGLPWDTRTDTFGWYATFVASLAGYGADAIEIWNEPNLPREWQEGRIGVENYLQLLRNAYGAIKTINPNTLVISGALAPTGFYNGCTELGCDDLPFLQGLVAAGGLDYLDCVGVHYNEGLTSPLVTTGDPRDSQHHGRYYQTLVDTYWQTIGGKRPLCFTELGYLSGEEWGYLPPGFTWRGLPYVGGINLTVAQQAEYLGEAVQLSRTQGKVHLLIIWNIDSQIWTDDPQAGYAIIRPNGDCPACSTIQAAMQ